MAIISTTCGFSTQKQNKNYTNTLQVGGEMLQEWILNVTSYVNMICSISNLWRKSNILCVFTVTCKVFIPQYCVHARHSACIPFITGCSLFFQCNNDNNNNFALKFSWSIACSAIHAFTSAMHLMNEPRCPVMRDLRCLSVECLQYLLMMRCDALGTCRHYVNFMNCMLLVFFCCRCYSLIFCVPGHGIYQLL